MNSANGYLGFRILVIIVIGEWQDDNVRRQSVTELNQRQAATDLVSELYVVVTSASGASATIGATLQAAAEELTRVTVGVRDPDGRNHNGGEPAVSRVALIVGKISGVVDNPEHHSNPTTRVIRRFTRAGWSRGAEYLTITADLPTGRDFSVRVRGTNTDQPKLYRMRLANIRRKTSGSDQTRYLSSANNECGAESTTLCFGNARLAPGIAHSAKLSFGCR